MTARRGVACWLLQSRNQQKLNQKQRVDQWMIFSNQRRWQKQKWIYAEIRSMSKESLEKKGKRYAGEKRACSHCAGSNGRFELQQNTAMDGLVCESQCGNVEQSRGNCRSEYTHWSVWLCSSEWVDRKCLPGSELHLYLEKGWTKKWEKLKPKAEMDLMQVGGGIWRCAVAACVSAYNGKQQKSLKMLWRPVWVGKQADI